MALVIQSKDILQHSSDSDLKLWLYNGMDCCLTGEVFDNLWKIACERKTPLVAYDYEIETLDTAIDCMVRGMKMDPTICADIIKSMEEPRRLLQDLLNLTATILQDEPLNHDSSVQLKRFFYEVLAIDPIKKRVKGEVKIDTGREALEKIIEYFPRAKMAAKIIIALKDIDKKIQVLTSKKDWDGRIRSSFNVAGTETWRWSSRKSVFWTGANLQNITEELRHAFVADPGYTFFNADAEQADARILDFEAGDPNYHAAITSGDLHTNVAKMIWPNLPWTGDPKLDREIAEQPFYRHFDYRFMCKKAGHGTNYILGPHSLSRHLHIHLRYAVRFALLYLGGEVKYADLARWHQQDPAGGFDLLIEQGTVVGSPPKNNPDARILRIKGAFEGIRGWQNKARLHLQQHGNLVNIYGFVRNFWQRLTDEATIREGVAFLPQSAVGILTSKSLTRIRRELSSRGLQIFGQVHDAVMGQFPTALLDELAPAVLECCRNPITSEHGTLTIPFSLSLGSNWGKFNDDPNKGPLNLTGLKKWKGK